MKNTLPLAPDGLARGVRIGRHAAAVLLILPIILNFVPLDRLIWSWFESGEEIRPFGIRPILWPLLGVIAYFPLWRIASDAPTKTAALLLGVCGLIALLFNGYNLLCPILFNSQPLEFVFGVIITVIIDFAAVYALSLLLRNRRLGSSDRSWIGLRVVAYCFSIISSFVLIWHGYLTDFDLPWSHLWMNSGYYQIFSYAWSILQIIALWRLAHCPLFAGRREETEPLPAGFYSPLNRYMVALVIASAVAVGTLTLLYSNAVQIVG